MNIFNIFKSIFHSRASPKVQNSVIGSPFFGVLSSSGKAVNERSAMQVTCVYACVRVIAETIASLPLQVYKRTEIGKEKALKHPLYRLLHDESNPEMTSFVLRETLMSHLLLWGNAFAQILRNGRGEIVALYPLMPNQMQVDRTSNGQIYYIYTKNLDDNLHGKAKQNGIQFYLKQSEVLHIPGLGFDGLIGYSPITMARNAIGMAIACEEFGSKFFSNGANPGGVLESPNVIKNPERLRESWNSLFGGSGNSHKIAILEENLKYHPISISPSDSQFLETRKFQIAEIARIFRVPPHLIGDLEHATFSNIENQSMEYVKYTLDPWVVRLEQSMQKSLLSESEKSNYFIKFNVDGLLRGDYQSRMNGYATGIQNGFLSVNDVRSLENLDLISEEEGGFLHFLNGNMTKLKNAGSWNAKYSDQNLNYENKNLSEKESDEK
ncbi:MAG: phage portal protein [Oscillospiraceae bacterium]|jgi:HK97 family phage portal protein|nr:phage portal protein [Oscillospiraceae bacterium]